jgi:hypothetical protein
MRRLLLAFAAALLVAAPLAAQDAVPIASCVLTPDLRDWPATTTIDAAIFQPTALHLDFSKKDGDARWPDVKPAGWDGPIEYTVWFGAMVNGRCHLAASINWWHGERDENSGPVLTAGHYPANLWYLDSTLGQHAPAAGEPIFVMVSAGAARGVTAFTVAERSNIIQVPFGASYTAPSQTPTPVPQPPVVVPPVVTPPVVPTPQPTPAPALDLSGVREQLAAIAAEVHGLAVTSTEEHREILTETRGISEWLQSHWKSITMIAGPFVTYATCRVTGKC